MFGTKYAYLHFLGWQHIKDKKRFHDSPGYFESLWAAGEVSGKGDYPSDLFALYEKRPCRERRRLKIEIKDGEAATEEVIKRLMNAGLNVELCDRRHWWSRCER